jgi:hypothetical protein
MEKRKERLKTILRWSHRSCPADVWCSLCYSLCYCIRTDGAPKDDGDEANRLNVQPHLGFRFLLCLWPLRLWELPFLRKGKEGVLRACYGGVDKFRFLSKVNM